MSPWTQSFTHTHSLTASFAISLTRVSSVGAQSNPTSLIMLNWPRESVACGVRAYGMRVGQWLWEKLLDLGQKGPSFNKLPCHMSGLLYLCSLWQKTSFLFLHIFKGLPPPEELLMQMIYGKACPSLSHIFCEHSWLHCCVSSLGIRLKRGCYHPGPNVFL